MISFRQLIVTIVSIFLALGLGILAGTTIIDQSLVKTLRKDTSAAERQSAKYKHQRDELSTLNTALVPQLVTGRLAHKQVVIVADANVDGGALGEVTTFLTQAKADVVTELRVTTSLDPNGPDAADLTRLLMMDGQSPGTDPTVTAADALADRLAAGPPALDPKTGKPIGHDLLRDLLSAGFLDFPHTSPPDPQAVGGAEQAVVVVTGGKRDPAVPFASFMLPFVQQLVARTVPVEVAEPQASAHSLVGVIRGEGAAATTDGLATVDDLSSADPGGGVAVVLALKDLLRVHPRGGNYGVKSGATGLLPAPP